MKSFNQYLLEQQMDLYHRTFKNVDKKIISASQSGGTGRRALNVFGNVRDVRRYHGKRSNDTVAKSGPILKTRGSSRNLIPDMEWSSDAYNPIFADIANKISKDPSYRPPSLSSGYSRSVSTIPGSRVVVDPGTGKKSIGPGWKPVWTDKEGTTSDQPIKGGKVFIKNLSGRKTITRTDTGKSANVDPGSNPEQWAGSSTINGGYGERRQLDSLARKGTLNTIMNRFLSTRLPKTSFKGFQTRTPFHGSFTSMTHADVVRQDLSSRRRSTKK